MHAAKLGWLSHRPKTPDGKQAERTRAEQLQADGAVIDMPEAPAYLLDWLQELGWCAAGAMGAAPISATEIAAWASGTGRRLQGWEFAALQTASRHYVTHLHDETPVPPDGQAPEKTSIAGKFKALAKQLNKTP